MTWPAPRSGLILQAEIFSHYAPQWRHDSHGTWRHVDLDDGSLAIFRTADAAKACAADMSPGIETRVVRYHTSGYTDINDRPEEPAPSTGFFETTDPERIAKRAKPREIEIIE